MLSNKPLYGNSFLYSVCKKLREGFTSDEIERVYANKTLQNFNRPSIMVQYLPELTRADYNDSAYKVISLDVVCFATKNEEAIFQEWSNEIKYRLEHLLRWIEVEGVKHRFRNFETHIDQDLYMRFHFTVEYTLYVNYVDDTLLEEMMVDLEKQIFVHVEDRVQINERNDR